MRKEGGYVQGARGHARGHRGGEKRGAVELRGFVSGASYLVGSDMYRRLFLQLFLIAGDIKISSCSSVSHSCIVILVSRAKVSTHFGKGFQPKCFEEERRGTSLTVIPSST